MTGNVRMIRILNAIETDGTLIQNSLFLDQNTDGQFVKRLACCPLFSGPKPKTTLFITVNFKRFFGVTM